MNLSRDEILSWLHEDDADRLSILWDRANAVRAAHVGTSVHLRGLLEISNHCARLCLYCGLRRPNVNLGRYRMSAEEIIESAKLAHRLGCGTAVLQAGEDTELTLEFIANVVKAIKAQTPLAVTLSLGERSHEEFFAWKAAGADRYLLRFETSNRSLFDSIHPPQRAGIDNAAATSDRPALLRQLRSLGYEIGGGVMIGIPGQTIESLADDLQLFAEMNLDMIGMGPFIAHPATPLGQGVLPPAAHDQSPATALMVYKMIALARLMCPSANIPATTALATIDRAQGRELGLARGANVMMPNFTPLKYRKFYEIYPDKACVSEGGQTCMACLSHRIQSIGRSVGQGPGGRT